MEVVDVDGHEFVVWHTATGELRSAPRWCPHLDHDLAAGWLDGDELMCAGHGWTFDGRGHVYKRNEFGRIDPKGAVPCLRISPRDPT
jgi:phenylpropionate dioxygenase-like ring-hydroxylating dioxygenase large terminal subunit